MLQIQQIEYPSIRIKIFFLQTDDEKRIREIRVFFVIEFLISLIANSYTVQLLLF